MRKIKRNLLKTGKVKMKIQWEFRVPSEEKERIAITYGDPADVLNSVENYALYPLPDAIENWHGITPLLDKDHWYDITAFYSRRKADLSKENAKLLYEYNQKSFDAAKEKGGLILYYQGVLLSNNSESISPDLALPFIPNCMSFCIWNTLQEAKEGAKIPEHKKASQMTSLWFDGFMIEKYQVMLKENSEQKTLIFQKKMYA
jgi:hypothetical protein